MQLVQHEQMWAMSRDIQAKLLQEAEKVRMLRKAQAPKLSWWSKVARRWQAPEHSPIQTHATPELG